jgi:nucleoside-diphosphate-sugar epimerase
LRASRDAGVKRVVLTSSFAAIGHAQSPRQRPFDESDWTDVNARGVLPYAKSKTLAEHAAWDFVAREGGALELAVVNPVMVFGPVLGADYSAPILLVKRLMDGAVPGCPRLYFGAVDVRDVADLHLRAMTDPAAKGERFLATAGDFVSIRQMAQILKDHLGRAARRVPTREVPDWLVRLVGVFDSSVRQILPDLGKFKNGSSEKARRLLAWSPRPREDAIAATAESLLRLGLLKDSAKKAA